MSTKVLDILNEISSTSSRKEKEKILNREKDNDLLKSVFDAALNPFRVFGIKKIPPYYQKSIQFGLDVAIDTLSLFEEREVTGNAAISYLEELLSSLHKDDAIVFERIIKKDLRCGVQAATVNKIWPKLIPTFPCLLGKAYDEKTIKNIKYPAYAQVKADGMRAMTWEENGQVFIYGRSGKPISFNGIFENRIRPLIANTNYVFDGELVVVDNDGNVLPRKVGNGILNKAIKGTISEEEAKQVRFCMWDLIDIESFKQHESVVPYHERLNKLESLVNNSPSIYYSVIETRILNSFDEVNEYFEEVLEQNEEGIMLKNTDHVWKNKRSNDLIKFKSELECDLEIIGWNPGTEGTAREGKVGSLVCSTKDRKIEVSISGFTEDLLNEISSDPDSYIGRIVTVKHNGRIKSKDKNREHVDSLFLPRFVELREDKTVADESKTIK